MSLLMTAGIDFVPAPALALSQSHFSTSHLYVLLRRQSVHFDRISRFACIELCWSQSPSSASIACRMRWLVCIPPPLGLEMCTSNLVGAALPHQCLARCDTLFAALLPSPPERASYPRLIKRQDATIGNCLCLHLAGRTQHETVCSSFVGSLAAVMAMVMTHLAPEGISLSQNSSRTTNSRESPRARAFHTNRAFGSHLDLDFSDSTSCREALRSDMAWWMSQLFPFGAPHGAALALFVHCLGAGRRHYCTCCAR